MAMVTHPINKGLQALKPKRRDSNTFRPQTPCERDRWTRICETYASSIKFEHPSWPKAKVWQHAEKRARSKIKEVMEKQEESYLSEMISDTDSERSDQELDLDHLQSKAPINEYNHESHKVIKNLLTSMKESKDLSYQLMNPIIRRDNLILIKEIRKAFDGNKREARKDVMQMALLHLETAAIHQVLLDNLDRRTIRRGNKWAIRSVFDGRPSRSDSKGIKDHRSLCTDFHDHFLHILKCTQKYLPERDSILSYQESMALLEYLTVNEDIYTEWPVALCTGSTKFTNIFTNMYESTFSADEATEAVRIYNSPDIGTPEGRAKANNRYLHHGL